MFDKILIANRGEIACRIMATVRRMGISTVAVYSQADRDACHVELADEAWEIGPPPARLSYLVADRILDVAERAAAQAIHPGYGFLSENADFAQACADRGIVFIGPPASAIRAMGSKSAAKALMERTGVPLVPGYHGEDQSLDTLTQAAERIGYPVLLKASAGGGGRGMRVVEAPDALADAIERAGSEAQASFGDAHLLVEKYLTRPRHIEVQVFADTHGNIVSLFERDCSIQRRHQKVLEESPAPHITPAQRQSLGEAAIAAARAVGYVGAGTVEFICEDERFYFMEMNTRLQVEHPVTEMVTGQDLVEWQVRVAAGEPLPLTQEQLSIRGHAIEARICAENPERDFASSTGILSHLRPPAQTDVVRVDTGVRQGDEIGAHYDSMIAKLIVWGEDRTIALRRLARALSDYELVGVSTNLSLLRNVVRHQAFQGGRFDTGFIGHHPDVTRAASSGAFPPSLLAAAALSVLAANGPVAQETSTDQWSPWSEADGWHLNGEAREELQFGIGMATVHVRAVRQAGGSWRLALPGGEVLASLKTAGDRVLLDVDGARLPLRIVRLGNQITVILNGENYPLTLMDPFVVARAEPAIENRLTAPTPARVDRVMVAAGALVARGDTLLVLEAMKMETSIRSPADGLVEAVHVKADDLVKEGAELVRFKAREPE